MIHLGDITKISGYEVPIVDCVIGGSPCQDLSIAGKREGLAGARSGLFMEQIRLVKEMRKQDAERNRADGRADRPVRPRYMVWENVPGAFSSNKGKDFAAVLEETIRIAEPEAPDVPVPPKGWSNAGAIVGDGWSIAWRTHDAQHWGVPQRRKRISLIADFGGKSAPEILFECQSLPRNTEPSGEERKGPSEGTQGSTSYAVRKTLDALNCGYPACNQGGMAVVAIENHPADSRVKISDKDLCQSLTSRMGTGGGNVPMVMSFEPGIMSRDGGHYYEDVCGTLRANMGDNQFAVCGMDGYNGALTGDVSSTLGVNCGMTTGRNGVIQSYTQGSFGKYIEGCGTLRANGGDIGGGSENLVVNDVCLGNGQETVGTLMACASTKQWLGNQEAFSGSYHVINKAIKSVRRLTPLECERLQGFPDGWTDIGEWIDSKGKKHDSSDSARYKALGNSIALPFWRFLCKRISAQYARKATMASLFDGIGGFPLVWEEWNGKGSAVWASEIEEFPIAVTKYHFKEGME